MANRTLISDTSTNLMTVHSMPTLLRAMQARRPPTRLDNVSDQRLELDADATAAGLHLRGVERCTVVCTGRRVAQITIEDCVDVIVHFGSVIATVDVLRCRGVHLAYTGSCGTITIDGSSHITVNIPAAAIDATWVVSTRVSQLTLRQKDDKDDDEGITTSSNDGNDSFKASDEAELVLDSVENSTISWQNGRFVATPLQRQTLFTSS